MDTNELASLADRWDRMSAVYYDHDYPEDVRVAAAETLITIGDQIIEAYIKPRLELVCSYCGCVVVMGEHGYIHETSAERIRPLDGIPASLLLHNLAGTPVGAYDVMTREDYEREA